MCSTVSSKDQAPFTFQLCHPWPVNVVPHGLKMMPVSPNMASVFQSGRKRSKEESWVCWVLLNWGYNSFLGNSTYWILMTFHWPELNHMALQACRIKVFYLFLYFFFQARIVILSKTGFLSVSENMGMAIGQATISIYSLGSFTRLQSIYRIYWSLATLHLPSSARAGVVFCIL